MARKPKAPKPRPTPYSTPIRTKHLDDLVVSSHQAKRGVMPIPKRPKK